MASKAFSGLTDLELNCLEGMIEVIEMQRGCNVGCLCCGTNAGPIKGYMPWDKFMAISDGIASVREENGIELLAKAGSAKGKNRAYKIMAGRTMDPVMYHSKDDNSAKTIWDFVKEMHSKHNKYTQFTTAGWKPGDNFMQHAAEEIAKSARNGEKLTEIMYSVKTVGLLARRDFDEYLMRVLNTLDDSATQRNRRALEENLTDFLKNSRYVQQLSSNMETLHGCDAYFEVQHITKKDLKRLPDRYKRYSFLFSKSTVEAIVDYVNNQAKHDGSSAYSYKSGERSLLGSGRAITELNLKPYNYHAHIQNLLKKGKNPLTDLPGHSSLYGRLYSAMINYDSSLSIMLGSCNIIGSQLIPPEFFEARARYFDKKEPVVARWHRTMAGLQGRRILE